MRVRSEEGGAPLPRHASRQSAARRSRAAGVAVLLLIAALVLCGCGEDPPSDSSRRAAADSQTAAPADPISPTPPTPTAAEISKLVAQTGAAAPVARALLVVTAALELSPSERDRRLTTMVANFDALLIQLPLDAGDDDLARNLANRVAASLRAGNFETARSAIAEAVAPLQADPDAAEPPRLAKLRAEEGQVALLQGQDAEAAELFQRALGGVPGDEALTLARLVGWLGVAQVRMGQLDDACSNLEQAVRLRKAHQGNGHPALAAAFEQLADCYWVDGKYANAQKLYERAVSIWQAETSERAGAISRVKVRIDELERLRQTTLPGQERT